jgi:N6-adenosine-specific RNA methylase IME4
MTTNSLKKRNGMRVGAKSDIDPGAELIAFAGSQRFATVLADPPWRFINRTGKMAPEHRRLSRYDMMTVQAIAALPIARILKPTAHLYVWVPNALLPDGIKVLAAWGFEYKSNIIWHKIRKDGGSDGRGVGFYFRNVTEILLFGVRGKNARTLAPGRTQVNYIGTRKREHSRKPDEQYKLIEACSPGPYLEMFARGARPKWSVWGNQAEEGYEPTWDTYSHNSASERRLVAAAE